MRTKPLGRRAYGSIGHLPDSRMGPGDHHVHEGQARICTEKVRDRHDLVIVPWMYSYTVADLLGMDRGTLREKLRERAWPARMLP